MIRPGPMSTPRPQPEPVHQALVCVYQSCLPPACTAAGRSLHPARPCTRTLPATIDGPQPSTPDIPRVE